VPLRVFKAISMRHSLLPLVLLVGCATASSGSGTPGSEPLPRVGDSLRLPTVRWSAEEQAVHVLNRLAYGPSPADLRRVEQMGPAAWTR
jgi:hypothetical protein